MSDQKRRYLDGFIDHLRDGMLDRATDIHQMSSVHQDEIVGEWIREREAKEPMVTVPRKAVEAALARLDRTGLYQCANQEEHDEVCHVREALRSALGEP